MALHCKALMFFFGVLLLASPALAHNPGSVEIAQCTEVLKAKPDDHETRRRRAELFIAFGDYKDAIADCHVLAKVKAHSPWIFVLRGRAYAMGMQYKKAVADFTKAMEAGEKGKDVYLLRASVYRDMKNYKASVADFTAALKIEDQPSVYYDRAEVYMIMKKYKAALADFERFVKYQPSSILYENLAKACLGAGEVEKGLGYANTAVEKTEKFAWNYLLRARILKKLNRGKEAAQDLDRALARATAAVTSEYGPTLYDLTLRSEVLIEMDRLDDALEDLDTCIEMEEEAPALYLRRAALFRRMGRMDRAKKDEAKAAAVQKRLDEEKAKSLTAEKAAGKEDR